MFYLFICFDNWEGGSQHWPWKEFTQTRVVPSTDRDSVPLTLPNSLKSRLSTDRPRCPGTKIIVEPSQMAETPLRKAELWGSERQQRKEQQDLEVLGVNNNLPLTCCETPKK